MQLDNEDPHDKLRKAIWDQALHTYAISYLFTRKKIQVSKNLRNLTFLGIVIPLFVGAFILNYGKSSKLLDFVIYWVLSPLALIQLVMSLWSIVAKWTEKSEYYSESSLSNGQLSDEFESLASRPPSDLDELQSKFEKLQIIQRQRDQQDSKYPLSETEKRRGMRYGLRKFQRECVGCKKVPTDMTPTECTVCGNF